MKNKWFLLFFLSVFSTASLFCQKSNKIGLSGTIQQGQFGIAVPVWLGEKFALIPAFDIKIAETVGTDLGIGLAPRFYLRNAQVSPYVGFRIGALINIPSEDIEINTDTKTDILAGLAFGGEYFLS